MDRIYAVGDIHGAAHQLTRALRLIEADGGPDAPIVFLGDYVDRGPDSRAVLQTLIDGQAEGRPWVCIKGNHDRLFERFLGRGEVFDPLIRSGKAWVQRRLGGLDTLASYGDVDGFDDLLDLSLYDNADALADQVAALHARLAPQVPDAHRDFLVNLPLYHEVPGLVFAHAGIYPGLPLDRQQEDDLIWIREPFLSDTRDHGALVVHGHTVLDRPQHYGNRVNLDGGAGYGRLLVPAVFDDSGVHILTEKGRWPLTT